jgi:DNA-binding transcriptional LysR family regulator
MNRLEALRLFCAAAESASFREAATRSAVSPQVITRVIKDLEADMGEPLFHRSTRGVRLTQFGEDLARRSAEAVSGVDGLFPPRGAADVGYVSGPVRVAAPSALGRRIVVPGLVGLRQSHPELRIDLRLSEVVADVVDGQIDVGVRIGPMRDSRFVARAVSPAHLFFVGAPGLVARMGSPDSSEALLRMPLTALVDRNSGRLWPWMFRGGAAIVPARPAFVTDDPEAECDAAVSGLGFSQLPGHLALPQLRAGRLVRILDALCPEPSTMYVYRPHQSPVPARVRVVFDALCTLLEDCEGAQQAIPLDSASFE